MLPVPTRHPITGLFHVSFLCRRNGPATPSWSERTVQRWTPTPTRSTWAWVCTSTTTASYPSAVCVQAAEKTLMEKPTAWGYLPIDGIVAYDNAAEEFGFWRRQRASHLGPRNDCAGYRRYRRPQDWCRLPQKSQPCCCQVLIRPEMGKTTARCLPTRLRIEVGTYAY